MKRIRLGRKIEFWLCAILLLIGEIVFVCFLVAERDSAESIYNLIIWSIILLLYFLISFFIQDFSWFIKLKDNRIELKSPLQTIQIYNKWQIRIRYAVKEYRGNGHTTRYPCLIIGEVMPNMIYFKDTARYKLVYEDYFLIVLTAQKLNYITAWYNQKIELPKKEEFIEINTEGAKRVRQFYDLIEKYNNTLMLNGGTKDENSGQPHNI